jgi:replication factor A1
MTDDELAQYIDDILEELRENQGKDVPREELEKELRRFLEYGVPADHAKQTLVKKYTTKERPQPSTERCLIVDLKPNLQSVNVIARIVSINPREITVKGEQRTIYYGILGDESGTVAFTAWKDFEVSKGDVLEIANAYTKEWQGAVKLNFGDRTRLAKTDDARIPEVTGEPRSLKIKDLRGGLSSVELTGRILELTEREVEASGQKKTVYSGLIGDETGKAQFTAWHDFGLKEGMVIKITGGYVKTWKGIPQLSFDQKAAVEKADADLIPKKEVKTQRVSLAELADRNGALDIEVLGTVIEVRRGSGLVQRCPDCNRVLQDNKCPTHGEVTGIPDLRLKLTVDDGTGSISTILGRPITEKLLGKAMSELQDQAATLEETLDKMLFGHRLLVSGNALGDDFGITIIAHDAVMQDFDIAKEVEAITGELEDLR